MLQVNEIRANFAQACERLSARNFENPEEVLGNVLKLEDLRKQIQLERDTLQAESNTISKQIGKLMQAGNKEEAEKIKLRTSEIKTQVKSLEDSYSKTEADLTQILYTIPNIPHSSVPAGKSAEDNEIVLENGTVPQLEEGNKSPHWDLIKKYDIVDFDQLFLR